MSGSILETISERIAQLDTAPGEAPTAEGIGKAREAERLRLGRMPLHRFAESAEIVCIYSEHLQEVVLLAGRRALVRRFRDLKNVSDSVVCYQGEELLYVLRLSPDALKTLHETKRVFYEGRIVAVETPA